MTKTSRHQLVSQLAGLLDRATQLQRELLTALRAKLEAMRRSGVEAMLSASRSEHEITQRINGLNDERADVVTRLAREVGLPPVVAGKAVTLRALTARLDEKSRRLLDQAATTLRQHMLAVGEANRTVQLVCQEMLRHFKTMFSAMVQDESAARGYQADGEAGVTSGPRVFEAVA